MWSRIKARAEWATQKAADGGTWVLFYRLNRSLRGIRNDSPNP